jgi:hypothetical protein
MKVVKKTYLLPQQLITQVKRAFKAKTETEAIIRVLEEYAFSSRIASWHKKNRGKLKIQDLYGRG